MKENGFTTSSEHILYIISKNYASGTCVILRNNVEKMFILFNYVTTCYCKINHVPLTKSHSREIVLKK